MRLFLALPIPQAERNKLVPIRSRLPGGRPVHPDDIHITMVFLGDGSVGQADELVDAIAGLRLTLPRIKLAEPGVFGRSQPNSVWLAVTPQAPLLRFHGKLARLARGLGFAVPGRKYVPHVTLARFSPGMVPDHRLASFLEGCGATSFEPFQPHVLTLFQSMIGCEPPIYDALNEFPVSPE